MVSETQHKQHKSIRFIKRVDKDTKPAQAFWMKFNNDWNWSNSAGLAYSLILSIFPILIAFLAILGLTLGNMDSNAYDHVVTQTLNSLSITSSVQDIIKAVLRQLAQQSGILGIIAVVLAIFNGSRLFLFMEGCFDVIYHVKPRNVIAQNVMAVGMLFIFVILIPIMLLASSAPALATILLQKIHLSALLWNGVIVSMSGIVGSLLAAYLLFQTIYIVVPNQKISFKHSWLGAVVAAILLELYLVLFPLYVTYFLRSFSGALSLLILLVFFYYFAMILFLGAEVNAFTMGVRETRYDIATMVHLFTSHLQTEEKEIQEEAAPSHKDEPPKDIQPKEDQARQA
jgi:membrane protein